MDPGEAMMGRNPEDRGDSAEAQNRQEGHMSLLWKATIHFVFLFLLHSKYFLIFLLIYSLMPRIFRSMLFRFQIFGDFKIDLSVFYF